MEPSIGDKRRRVQQPADWEPDITAEVEVKRKPEPAVEHFAGRTMTILAAAEMAADVSVEGMGA